MGASGRERVGSAGSGVRQAGEQARRWTAWLVRARADPEFFTRLWEEMEPWLRVRLRRGEHTSELFRTSEADDVLHEVCLKVWVGRFAFDPHRAGAKTWVWTIARNTGIDALRRRGRARSLDAGRVPLEVPDARPAPSAVLEQRELLEVVERARDRLDDPRLRQALELRLRGLTYEEIAGQMGVPRTTVVNYLDRARLVRHAALAAAQGR